ncbi:MAG: ABC transporter permease [Kiritimatiellae bacterium]|nr:ABC transporter permease [Kiritimatiellia bacterium]MDD5521503.1 ABC transporter permease [Kiritimatiellia bacterium]
MIELSGISRRYRTGPGGNGNGGNNEAVVVNALSDVTLKIEQGEFVAIIGPSGSGKSTLLHILGLLDKPDSGTYRFLGKDVTRLSDNELAALRNGLAGFIFQQFHLLPRLTAIENALLPLVYAGRAERRDSARARLAEVGLSHREEHRPNQMSGGEQQRVAIARSMVNDPVIIFADEPTGNLDSKSEKEIVDILKKLNEAGKTVVMVTHEREIAEHAGRVIQMRDGYVVSDERRDASLTPVKESVSATDSDKIDNVLSVHRAVGRAEFGDQVQQAFHSIFSHKMRSALSMLGILIGVGAVIAMLAVGQGARESVQKGLASLGSNMLHIHPGAVRTGGVALQAGAVTRLTLQDVEAVAKLDTVRHVCPNVNGRAQLVYKNKNWNTRLQGNGAAYAEMRASVPIVGRFFMEEEVQNRARVVIIGITVAKELFGDSDPVGKIIRINRVEFTVLGISPPKGSFRGWDQDDFVVVPITTAMYRLFGLDYISDMDAEVKEASMMDDAKDEIKQLLLRRHRVSPSNSDVIQIHDMTEIQDMLSSTAKTMGWLLGSIAAISLVVGGIGIMNIMLVSVTERTKEIGLRKAIGARRSDIMVQFLIEAVVMTLSGGMIGIILGSGTAYLLSTLAEWPVKVSGAAVALAVTFSVIIGIIFGLWPARQASRLDPITALKYE